MPDDNPLRDIRDVNLSLNTQLKRRMEHMGMTLSEVSQRSGLSASYVSMLLNGQRVWRLDNLALLCRALGCTVQIGLLANKERDPR